MRIQSSFKSVLSPSSSLVYRFADVDRRPARSFTRVKVRAGQTVDAKMEVADWSLRSWNEQTHAYEVRPGPYILGVGSDSQSILSETTLTVK